MAGQLAEAQHQVSERQREIALELTAVGKTYGRGDDAVVALRDLSMRIPRRSFTAVMGPSGSGKSTFMHCAAGLDQPSAGSVRLGQTELVGMGEPQLTMLRRRRIGFVFQSFNLVASLTVQQNILLPLRLAGDRPDRGVLHDVAAMLGIDHRLRHHPAQLSGGQQQRVAIARALVARPEVIFADEPTGSLDAETASTVLQLLRHAVDRWGQTVVMVTHDPLAASCADSVLFLADGRLADAVTGASSDQIAARTSRLRAGVGR
jgi:putative ABC transport system ATP-binding protein